MTDAKGSLRMTEEETEIATSPFVEGLLAMTVESAILIFRFGYLTNPCAKQVGKLYPQK
jgi:hypothetical protein